MVFTRYLILIIKIKKIKRRTSKSVYDCKEKNNLLFCNMNTHKTRKVICEKVQVGATVIDRNL